MPVAELPEAREEVVGGHDIAALPEDRLHHHRGELVDTGVQSLTRCSRYASVPAEPWSAPSTGRYGSGNGTRVIVPPWKAVV